MYIRLKMSPLDVEKPFEIRVHLSPVCGVTHEALRAAFALFAGPEGFSAGALVIVPAEFELSCEACGYRARFSERVEACPACRSEHIIHSLDRDFWIDGIRFPGGVV